VGQQLKKIKIMKIKVETASLETLISKLEKKYNDENSKPLSDTITHLKSALRSIKKV
tara:strand:- start:356 stop:526 length:171 start_codon:yes stop_codon:yes gene_type:complete